MQQLETSKQIVEAEQRYKRMGKGRLIAQSRKVYRLRNTDVFYVESENSNDIFYYTKYNPDVIEYCSCLDSSTRQIKCKHLWSIEFAIRMGTLKNIDRLPADAKRNPNVAKIGARSYTQDDYSF
jgi:hypothetical protein